MKYSKVGVGIVFAAALLMALPSRAAVLAEQQKSDDNNRDREEEVENTSSPRDERETSSEKFKDQDEDNNEKTTSTGQKVSEEHRSEVATFVQNLLKTADDDRSGIGEQVREVAKEQNESLSTTTEAIKEVENRSSFKTFLIGTDYKNIGVIRSHIAQTQARIDQLTRLLDKATTSTISASTTAQLQVLKQAEEKLTKFVTENENKFSLFGWFVRLFSK